MVGVSIAVLWYQKQIHQVIFGAMMFCYIQFGIISKTLFWDALVFGVSLVFAINTKMFVCAKKVQLNW